MHGCRQQGHAGSKTLHQQNPPVLNWRCRLTRVDVYNGRKTVVMVVVVVVIKAYNRVYKEYTKPVPLPVSHTST